MDLQTSMLEREAYPALDELTSKLSTLNLERVRQIKSRLVAISGRVQKVLFFSYWYPAVVRSILDLYISVIIRCCVEDKWISFASEKASHLL